MDKLGTELMLITKLLELFKAHEDFFKQIVPESPLKEAFRKWNETTKQIEKEKGQTE